MIKIVGFDRLRKRWYRLLASKVELRKRIWQYWHNQDRQRTVAFLVGSGRSGTNMLVSGLARSWAVWHSPCVVIAAVTTHWNGIAS